MKKIGVFVDSVNMYFTIRRYYSSILDYDKLMEYVGGLGEVSHASVYGLSRDSSGVKFRSKLKHLGFKVHCTSKVNANQCAAMSVDIGSVLDQIDILILVSGDGGLIPIVRKAKELNKTVIVLGVKVCGDFRKFTKEIIELPTEFFRPVKTGRTNVHDVCDSDGIRSDSGDGCKTDLV